MHETTLLSSTKRVVCNEQCNEITRAGVSCDHTTYLISHHKHFLQPLFNIHNIWTNREYPMCLFPHSDQASFGITFKELNLSPKLRPRPTWPTVRKKPRMWVQSQSNIFALLWWVGSIFVFDGPQRQWESNANEAKSVHPTCMKLVAQKNMRHENKAPLENWVIPRMHHVLNWWVLNLLLCVGFANMTPRLRLTVRSEFTQVGLKGSFNLFGSTKQARCLNLSTTTWLALIKLGFFWH